VSIHPFIYVYVRICVCVYIGRHIYVYIYVDTRHIYAYTRGAWAIVCVCVHVRAYGCTCIGTIHTHTHTTYTYIPGEQRHTAVSQRGQIIYRVNFFYTHTHIHIYPEHRGTRQYDTFLLFLVSHHQVSLVKKIGLFCHIIRSLLSYNPGSFVV
jgi:hypothetical protein